MARIQWRQISSNLSGSVDLIGSLNISGDVTSSDVYINDWGSISASLSSIQSSIGSGGGTGIFELTGSSYATTNFLQITGSIKVQAEEEIPLEITSGSESKFKVDHKGIIILTTQSATPTAVPGGLYLDTGYDLFLGQN